jgi:VCBS repeat-containing protein
MKNLILSTLFLLLSVVVYSQTNISGAISSNTTWSLANSPYVVTGNTVVFENYTLTIEPGVVVKFEDNVQLRIQGKIIAIGNDSNNIVFTSNNTNPQRGSWNEINIEFKGTFTLDYVKMEYANNALNYNHVTSSSIKNSIFQFNNNAIRVESGNPQWAVFIEATKFINNDKGIANYHDEVNLKNCEFKNNRIGAELTESNVDSCLFEGNTEKGIACYLTTIKNSTIISNNIGLEQSFTSDSFKSHVTGNTVKNNVIGIKILNFGTYDVIVSNNTISNNSTYNVENTSSRGANFSNNCWSTEDVNEIENTILHGIDNINLGLVTFTPTSSGCPDSTKDIPPTLSDKSVTTNEDTALDIELTAVDPDSNQITYTIASNSSNGNLWITNNIVTYNPSNNFNGSDSFTVTANDGQYTSAPATISITVEAVNDAPVANNDSIMINEGGTTTVLQNNETSLLYNDTDVENNSLTSILVSNPTNGSLTLNSNGTFSYEHDGSDTTYDNFTYKTNDGDIDSNIAMVNITINPVNDNLPTDILLSNNSIQENISQTFIGQLTVTDLDLPSDSHAFELVNGIGDDNNSNFIINDKYLYSNTLFDYETQQTLSIRLKVIDGNNQSFEKSLVINVVNVNDINITSDTTNSYCSAGSGSGSINITSVNQTSGTLTYYWQAYNGGVLPSGQENSQNLTDLPNGNYYLSITDDNFTFNESFEISLIPQYNDLSICYVSSDDSETTKNRIYLNNQGNYNVAFYEVLRESSIANVYTTIGTISSTENSFLDDTSNNISQSYNYKVRLIDKCGITSSNSDLHKTMLLQSSIAVDNTVNLNWSDYQGTSFTTYNIFRNTNKEGFQMIGSVSSNSNSYNDTTANVADNNYEYYISIEVNACLNESARKSSNTSTEIKSNHQNIGTSLSLNDFITLKQVYIYPNPSSIKLNIKLSSGVTLVKGEVYNTLGQIIMETKEINFSIENLPSSTYFIKIFTSGGTTTRRFIKK